MSFENVIEVKGISKQFLRNGEPFWALKDVSFEVKKGEMLGIIGANGSGKSTLLKILSDILRPSEGSAIINGSCASVLDIGSGFHPDLTGIENVKMKAELLGAKVKVNQNIIDEIVDFSGLEEFINEPVKNYSNGMFVRLAFSIFKVLKQDIMLVDEVLSAGDLEFQTKIKESEFLNDSSGIIVSHELDPIAEYCNRILILEQGEILEITSPQSAIRKYREKNTVNLEEKMLNSGALKLNESVAEIFLLSSLSMRSDSETSQCCSKNEIEFRVQVKNISLEEQSLDLIPFIRPLGQQVHVHADSPTLREQPKPFILKPACTYNIWFRYPFHFFGVGKFSIGFIWSRNEEFIQRDEDIAFFQVDSEPWESNKIWSTFPILNRSRLSWSCVEVQSKS